MTESRALYVYVAMNGQEVYWEFTGPTRKSVREQIAERITCEDVSELKVRRARLTIFGS